MHLRIYIYIYIHYLSFRGTRIGRGEDEVVHGLVMTLAGASANLM